MSGFLRATLCASKPDQQIQPIQFWGLSAILVPGKVRSFTADDMNAIDTADDMNAIHAHELQQLCLARLCSNVLE